MTAVNEPLLGSRLRGIYCFYFPWYEWSSCFPKLCTSSVYSSL